MPMAAQSPPPCLNGCEGVIEGQECGEQHRETPGGGYPPGKPPTSPVDILCHADLHDRNNGEVNNTKMTMTMDNGAPSV
jgi:hypothetical protein